MPVDDVQRQDEADSGGHGRVVPCGARRIDEQGHKKGCLRDEKQGENYRSTEEKLLAFYVVVVHSIFSFHPLYE